jgi:hypothetical protein
MRALRLNRLRDIFRLTKPPWDGGDIWEVQFEPSDSPKFGLCGPPLSAAERMRAVRKRWRPGSSSRPLWAPCDAMQVGNQKSGAGTMVIWRPILIRTDSRNEPFLSH